MSTTTFARIVFLAGCYNLLVALLLVIPAAQKLIGLNIADPALGLLIAGLVAFTAIVQILASRDVRQYAWLIAYEGVLRFVAAGLLIPYGLFGHLGVGAVQAGIVDLVIGIVFLAGLPKATSRSLIQSLTGPPQG